MSQRKKINETESIFHLVSLHESETHLKKLSVLLNLLAYFSL